MQNDATTIYVKARENAVDTAVSRGKQMFQALTEPNEKIDETMLAAKLAEKLRISLSEATYFISSLDELIINELTSGNHVYMKLASFYSRLSGPLPTKDADPAEAGLYMLGCVRARPRLRNALKDCLKPSNVLSSERITIHDGLIPNKASWRDWHRSYDSCGRHQCRDQSRCC